MFNCFIRDINGLPFQTKEDIDLYKKILDRDNIRVFEWGCGNSTLFYAKFLKKEGRKFSWHSVDNDRKWYEQMKDRNKMNNVFLYLKEFLPFKQLTISACEYINFPDTLGKFDVIIIDGRYRNRCLKVAEKHINKGGTIILHDAQREYYKPKGGKYIKTGHWWFMQDYDNKVWIKTY